MGILRLYREKIVIKKTKHMNEDMLRAMNFVSDAFYVIIITNRI